MDQQRVRNTTFRFQKWMLFVISFVILIVSLFVPIKSEEISELYFRTHYVSNTQNICLNIKDLG